MVHDTWEMKMAREARWAEVQYRVTRKQRRRARRERARADKLVRAANQRQLVVESGAGDGPLGISVDEKSPNPSAR
ncbi:hypothetical protein BH09MYX1_BH09MYX1_27060 [soil metagenome]